MKKLVDFLTTLLILFFVFYIILYVVMGFPHPKWFDEGVKDLKGSARVESLK